MRSHDELAEWDAAYVLGALSSTERAEYEQHLAGCPECARAVRDLAGVPGLLSRVPPEDVPHDPAESPPVELLSRMRAAAEDEIGRRRRRRRRAVSVVAVAASAVLLTGGILVSQQINTPAPGTAIAMRQVHSSPLTATVQLVDRPWGTEVEMTCVYGSSTDWDGRAIYALYVVDHTGQASSISTWAAGPGSTSKLTAATAVPRAQIAQLQIRTTSGTVLLSTDPN